MPSTEEVENHYRASGPPQPPAIREAYSDSPSVLKYLRQIRNAVVFGAVVLAVSIVAGLLVGVAHG